MQGGRVRGVGRRRGGDGGRDGGHDVRTVRDGNERREGERRQVPGAHRAQDTRARGEVQGEARVRAKGPEGG